MDKFHCSGRMYSHCSEIPYTVSTLYYLACACVITDFVYYNYEAIYILQMAVELQLAPHVYSVTLTIS